MFELQTAQGYVDAVAKLAIEVESLAERELARRHGEAGTPMPAGMDEFRAAHHLKTQDAMKGALKTPWKGMIAGATIGGLYKGVRAALKEGAEPKEIAIEAAKGAAGGAGLGSLFERGANAHAGWQRAARDFPHDTYVAKAAEFTAGDLVTTSHSHAPALQLVKTWAEKWTDRLRKKGHHDGEKKALDMATIGSGLQTAAGLASMVPGVGTPVAAALGAAGGVGQALAGGEGLKGAVSRGVIGGAVGAIPGGSLLQAGKQMAGQMVGQAVGDAINKPKPPVPHASAHPPLQPYG